MNYILYRIPNFYGGFRDLRFFQGDRIVIGADNEEAARKVENLYSKLHLQTYVTDIKSAEMIKYASNAFLATKLVLSMKFQIYVRR